jgi:3-hydroxy-3-methylglutaryl CoA synthase/uncharacterized OB-fold protein
VGAAFGGRARGQRSVAAWDEDVVTMAIAAGEAALANAGGEIPDAVFLATCSSPLAEKSAAGLVAAAVGRGAPLRADDFGGTLRAGMAAIAAACDAVGAGTHERVLVVASELRTEAPGTPAELRVGDGAAAVVVSREGGPLRLKGRHHQGDLFAGQWKRADEAFRRTADARFAGEAGEGRLVPAALSAAAAAAEGTADQLTRAAVASLDVRSLPRLFKLCGVSQAAGRPDELQGATGHLGCAHALALLAITVDGAAGGEQIAIASGMDGADVFWLEATADVGSNGGPPEAEEIPHYGRYLKQRGLLPEAPGTPMEPFTSASVLHRERDNWWSWAGRRCDGCGTVQVLPLPACHHCRGEAFTPQPLERTGTVFTATAEHYNPSPEPPTGMLVVDLDPVGTGGRATVQWAGGAGAMPGVGGRVRLVLRKYHDADGWPHYFWKAVSE